MMSTGRDNDPDLEFRWNLNRAWIPETVMLVLTKAKMRPDDNEWAGPLPTGAPSIRDRNHRINSSKEH
jgi:hypothetical protein